MLSNNNPLNLRYNARNNWLGQLEPRNGFCSFETMTLGFRAALLTLRTYIVRHRRNTISQVVRAWAPPSDNNDTDHYIRIVCHHTAIGGEERMSWRDPYWKKVIWAMALMESGTDILRHRDDLDEAWEMIELEEGLNDKRKEDEQ